METSPPDTDGLTAKRHSRHASYNRAPLARRLTKGPLDSEYDPPAIETPSPLGDEITEAAEIPIPIGSDPLSSPLPLLNPPPPPQDFSYLQRADIYHSLTQLDLPPPFRAPSHQPPLSTPIPTLLRTSHFRSAAIAATHQLCTTHLLSAPEIFSLLYTRLATLTLINATPFAAQESKCLEDLNSPFYRDTVTNAHLLPWELRVLAVRLQGIGYSDSRRGISGHYDLARDARTEIKRTSGEERELWKERLKDLGVRVGNALVETGDLAAAARHFESLRGRKTEDDEDQVLNGRLALLYLRLGDVAAARRCLGEKAEESAKSGVNAMLEPLLSMAESRYEDAVTQWRPLTQEPKNSDIATQNLAVCLLYTGQLNEAQSLLASLISKGRSFHALTFNLATVYELCSEKSRGRKLELADKVAEMLLAENDGGGGGGGGGERANGDFKL